MSSEVRKKKKEEKLLSALPTDCSIPLLRQTDARGKPWLAHSSRAAVQCLEQGEIMELSVPPGSWGGSRHLHTSGLLQWNCGAQKIKDVDLLHCLAPQLYHFTGLNPGKCSAPASSTHAAYCSPSNSLILSLHLFC